jgi:hypothetical protein
MLDVSTIEAKVRPAVVKLQELDIRFHRMPA